MGVHYNAPTRRPKHMRDATEHELFAYWVARDIADAAQRRPAPSSRTHTGGCTCATCATSDVFDARVQIGIEELDDIHFQTGDHPPALAPPTPDVAVPTLTTARRITERTDSVFVCPPEWGITPAELRRLVCASEGWGSGLRHYVGSVLTLTGGGMAGVFAAASADLTSIATGIGTAVFGSATVVHERTTRRRARKQLADLDLSLVLEVTEPPTSLRHMAECPTPADLSQHLVLPPRAALTELWDTAVKEQRSQAARSVAAKAPPSRWTLARQRFEVVEAEWETLLLDPLSALEHAALLDVTKARTAAFVDAFGKTKDVLARHQTAGTEPKGADLDAFEDLTRIASTTWAEAKRWSAHVSYEWLPETERVHAAKAARLLALAADEGAALAERASAAENAAKLLHRIHSFVMPVTALAALEETTRLALPVAARGDLRNPILTPDRTTARTHP